MAGPYGIDLPEIFVNLNPFSKEVEELPSKLHNAVNFQEAMKIEYTRMYALFGVAEQIYRLNDIDNNFGTILDYFGSDYGVARGNYNDNDYREYIKLWRNNYHLNSGTIPDIRASIRLAFPNDIGAINVIDSRDGSVRIQVPVTISSEIFTRTSAGLTAAGIDLIIELTSSLTWGFNFSPGQEYLQEHDRFPGKAIRNKKIQSSMYFKKYVARINYGMEVN